MSNFKNLVIWVWDFFGFLVSGFWFLLVVAPQLQIFLQALLAAGLGGFIGLEREYQRKEAGLRTFSLVCLGSAFFTLLCFEFFFSFGGEPGANIDLTRIAQAIAVGIGFIGGGSIIFRDKRIEGLTTAAGLWVTAAIGMAVGAGFYSAAIFVSFLTVVILAGARLVEEKWVRTK